MPGILPMKVIKVGSSSQSRIAQACDRCRSKKIRCDGIRPCCSQCAAVGFECRTSDKLSRRAFPRGYTESLEERVRQLELEVRELKDLLDEKDEKIDMLSKMRDSARRPSAASAISPASAASSLPPPPPEDTFRVQASPLLLGVENSDSYFMGASSGRAFIESFRRKMQEHLKPCSDFNTDGFLHIQGCDPLVSKPLSPSQAAKLPPRLFSDRCVNVYFQEWAPLFPVLHKPTFLRVYEDFAADPNRVKGSHDLAQLFLVFSIAALSSDQPDLEQIAVCEQRWRKALDAVQMEGTMQTLQCLVLALMYCTIRADYKRLQHYKAVAVGLSHRLGLHQSQKTVTFGALTVETRKKVFWTLYTLDCFSAAILGLPKLVNEDDIHTEYPSNVDDEYVTEKGFQPSLPGEHTRVSSALALFRAARILAKVLDTNYPAATAHDLSLQQMASLEGELDAWSQALPSHLKLVFRQDRPSADMTGSRSPLLAMVYYYIRMLIFRPAVGSTLGERAAPALMSVVASSKHLVQISQLLEERGMAFSFCLNKGDLLHLCGMAQLYQCLDLRPDSMLMKDGERLVSAIIRSAEKANVKAPGYASFKRAAKLIISVDESGDASLLSAPLSGLDTTMAAAVAALAPVASTPPLGSPSVLTKSLPKRAKPSQGRAHAAVVKSEADALEQQDKLRRASTSQLQPQQRRLALDHSRSRSHQSLLNARREQQRSMSLGLVQPHQAALIARAPAAAAAAPARQDLDYLSMSETTAQSQPCSPVDARFAPRQQPYSVPVTPAMPQGLGFQDDRKPAIASASVPTAEWDMFHSAMDVSPLGVYHTPIYSGPPLSLPATPATPTAAQPRQQPAGLATLPSSTVASPCYGGELSPSSWDLSALDIGSYCAGSDPMSTDFDLASGGASDIIGSSSPTAADATHGSMFGVKLNLSDANSLSSGDDLARHDSVVSSGGFHEINGASPADVVPQDLWWRMGADGRVST